MATRDQDTSAVIADDAPAGVQVREGDYGERSARSSPAGRSSSRCTSGTGKPLQLLWTWTSPNLEFATVFVGVLAVVFGLSFWQAAPPSSSAAALGALTQAVLSARGPATACRRWCSAASAFGYWGNILPAGLNSVTARHRLVRGQQRQRHVRAQHAHPDAQGAVPGDHRRGPGRDRVLRAQPRARLRAVRLPVARGGLRDRLGRHPAQVHFGRAGRTVAALGGLPAGDRRGVRLRGGLEPVRRRLRPVLPADTDKARSRCAPASACSCPARSWRSPGLPRRPSWCPSDLGNPTGAFTVTCPPSSRS